MAIGSLAFGKIADRAKNPLRLYGVLELLVGCFALGFPPCSKGFSGLSLVCAGDRGLLPGLSLAQALLLVSLLLIPTALMGGTLPLLTRHLAARADALGRNLGLLYGLNTWGAVLGCSAAGFVLIAMME